VTLDFDNDGVAGKSQCAGFRHATRGQEHFHRHIGIEQRLLSLTDAHFDVRAIIDWGAK
jgi:hypothetical protein